MEATDVCATPFFSICIPAYNCGDEVLDALRSIRDQTDGDWEVVIADDGSSDDTLSICIQQDILPKEKVTVLETEHSGLLDTRRQLTEAARGEVVISLDADDSLCDVDALREIHEAFASTGCDFVMFNATRFWDSKAPFLDYGRLSPNDGLLVDISDVRSVFSKSYDLNNVAFKAYKRGLISFGPMRRTVQMTEDRFQVAQLLRNSSTCALIDKPFYYYRPSGSSITRGTFKVDYVRDQLYAEDAVDGLRSSCDIDLNDGNELLIGLIPVDLKYVRESPIDEDARLAAYSEIHDVWLRSGRAGSRTPKGLRLDRRITYRLFMRERFRLLDKYLYLFLAIKRVVKNG